MKRISLIITLGVVIFLLSIPPGNCYQRDNITLGLWHIWPGECMTTGGDCPTYDSLTTSREADLIIDTNCNFLQAFMKHNKDYIEWLDNCDCGIRRSISADSVFYSSNKDSLYENMWYLFDHSDWMEDSSDAAWQSQMAENIDTIYARHGSHQGFGGYYLAHEWLNSATPRSPRMDWAIDSIRSVDTVMSHEIRVVNNVLSNVLNHDPNFLTNIDKLDVFEIEAYPFGRTSPASSFYFIDDSDNGQSILGNTINQYLYTREKLKSDEAKWEVFIAGWAVLEDDGDDDWWKVRFGTREEMRILAYLALAMGAQGIGVFQFSSETYTWPDIFEAYGLVDMERRILNPDDLPFDDDRYEDIPYPWDYSGTPYIHIAELYGDLAVIGPTLARLYSDTCYSKQALPGASPDNHINIRSCTGDSIFIGEYYDSTLHDSLSYPYYFMPVNKVCCEDQNGGAADSQEITMTIRQPLNEYYALKDIYSDDIFIISADSLDGNGDFEFDITLPPGDGKLFRLDQCIHGATTDDTTWSDEVYLSGDFYVNSGDVLTIEAGTDIYFVPDYDIDNLGFDSTRCELIIEGYLVCEGTSTDSVRFLSMDSSPAKGDWKGINVYPGDDVEMEYTAIRHCDWGIYATADANIELVNSNIAYCDEDGIYAGLAYLNVDNCHFQSIDNRGVNLYKPDSTKITNCTFINNTDYGIYSNNSQDSLIITGNTFDATYSSDEYAIRLSSTTHDKFLIENNVNRQNKWEEISL